MAKRKVNIFESTYDFRVYVDMAIEKYTLGMTFSQFVRDALQYYVEYLKNKKQVEDDYFDKFKKESKIKDE